MCTTGLDSCNCGTHAMTYDIRNDRTYTAHEVRGIIEAQGTGFRRAFEELQGKLEDTYREEIERVHDAHKIPLSKWNDLSRWTTWGCWAMFWISGFLFRPFF